MSELVKAARRYLGAPFLHRGRSPRGMDCVGLPLLAYRDLGVELPDFVHYMREPDPAELIRRMVLALGEPIKQAPVQERDMQAGDVILMVLPRETHPHHVGIVMDYSHGGALAVIHASGEAMPAVGKRRAGQVIEHRMDAGFIANITHVFRRPV